MSSPSLRSFARRSSDVEIDPDLHTFSTQQRPPQPQDKSQPRTTQAIEPPTIRIVEDVDDAPVFRRIPPNAAAALRSHPPGLIGVTGPRPEQRFQPRSVPEKDQPSPQQLQHQRDQQRSITPASSNFPSDTDTAVGSSSMSGDSSWISLDTTPPISPSPSTPSSQPDDLYGPIYQNYRPLSLFKRPEALHHRQQQQKQQDEMRHQGHRQPQSPLPFHVFDPEEQPDAETSSSRRSKPPRDSVGSPFAPTLPAGRSRLRESDPSSDDGRPARPMISTTYTTDYFQSSGEPRPAAQTYITPSTSPSAPPFGPPRFYARPQTTDTYAFPAPPSYPSQPPVAFAHGQRVSLQGIPSPVLRPSPQFHYPIQTPSRESSVTPPAPSRTPPLPARYAPQRPPLPPLPPGGSFRQAVPAGPNFQYPFVRSPDPAAASWYTQPPLFHRPAPRLSERSYRSRFSNRLYRIPSVSERDEDEQTQAVDEEARGVAEVECHEEETSMPSASSRGGLEEASVPSALSGSGHQISRQSSRSVSEVSGDTAIVSPFPRLRRRTIDSATSSASVLSDQSGERDATMPLPLFAELRPSPPQRDSAGGRPAGLDDGQSPTLSLPRHSHPYLHRESATSKRSSQTSTGSSLLSQLASSLPSWAREYYQHGERGLPDDTDSLSSMGTVEFGEAKFGVRRPGNRQQRGGRGTGSSGSSVGGVFTVYGTHQHYSPHLTPDKRGSRTFTLSPWRAPTFDEDIGTLFGAGNRQILLFCIGFLFPPAWLLASILPLPPRSPPPADEKPMSSGSGGGKLVRMLTPLDLEKAQVATFHSEVRGGPQKRQRTSSVYARGWEKARWWRCLNRTMAVVGIVILGIVIALAVVASTAS